MKLQPKVVKPKVAHTRWCPCAPLGVLDWGTPRQVTSSQHEAFRKALDHARREHWTPEVAR